RWRSFGADFGLARRLFHIDDNIFSRAVGRVVLESFFSELFRLGVVAGAIGGVREPVIGIGQPVGRAVIVDLGGLGAGQDFDGLLEFGNRLLVLAIVVQLLA